MGSEQIRFASSTEFVTAPIVWVNEDRQITDIGEPGARAIGDTRVALTGAEMVFATVGDSAQLAEWFLRYAFAMATEQYTPFIAWRPIVTYTEDRTLSRSHRPERIASFSALAHRVGVHELQIYQPPAP